MSGRRYNIPGALKGLRLTKREPISRLKSLVALQPTKFPLPSASDLVSMFKMLDQAPLRAETLLIDSGTLKDLEAWSKGEFFPRRPLPPIYDFRFVHFPRVELAQPGGPLFFPRDVELWAMDSALSLRPRIESHEDYRIRQAEEIVEFGGERNALEKFRDGQAGDERRGRGMVIALNPNIKHVDIGLWQVPSHSDSKPCVVYDVDMNANTCTCLDHKKRKKKCKHIYAVEYLQSKTSMWQSEHMGKFLSGIDYAANDAKFTASFWAQMSAATRIPAQYIKPLRPIDLAKSGRSSSEHPNLAGLPRCEAQALIATDYAALETRIIATMLKERMPIGGVKVTSFIHDEITLEIKVAPPVPADAVTLKVPV